MHDLKEALAEQVLENRLLKKGAYNQRLTIGHLIPTFNSRIKEAGTWHTRHPEKRIARVSR